MHLYLMHCDPNVGAGLLAKAVVQSAHGSLAHRLREQARSHKLIESSRQHCTALLCFSVGAGLPAMQTPRCIRHNQLMPSQASQLPQFDRVPPPPSQCLAFLWELACLRCRHLGVSGITSRCHRRQASSHKLTEFSRPHRTAWLFCGSWLACDAGNSVYQAQPVDAIAGKPAPTLIGFSQWICGVFKSDQTPANSAG